MCIIPIKETVPILVEVLETIVVSTEELATRVVDVKVCGRLAACILAVNKSSDCTPIKEVRAACIVAVHGCTGTQRKSPTVPVVIIISRSLQRVACSGEKAEDAHEPPSLSLFLLVS